MVAEIEAGGADECAHRFIDVTGGWPVEVDIARVWRTSRACGAAHRASWWMSAASSARVRGCFGSRVGIAAPTARPKVRMEQPTGRRSGRLPGPSRCRMRLSLFKQYRAVATRPDKLAVR